FDEAEVDQDPPERFGRVPMLLECLLELLIRDEALLDEDLPELFWLLLHRRHARFTDGRRRDSSRCFFVMGPRLLKEAGELLGQQDPVDLSLVPARFLAPG